MISNSKIFNITSFGAKNGNNVLNTEAFRIATEKCRDSGGGILFVPAGVFRSGSIRLYSHMTLLLADGAVLKSTAVPADFPPIGFYHREMGETTSFLYAMEAEDIHIRGEGTGCIDLSSEITYPPETPQEYAVDSACLTEKQRGEGIYPKNNNRVNQPILFESCMNVTVENVRIIGSPCWTVTFSRCRNIDVHGVVIRNGLNIQNNDGIHLSACENARISDCDITCADDCTALTCITAPDGKNDTVIIENCVFRSRSAAVRIGHCAEHVTVRNIEIPLTNRGIGIFAASGHRLAHVTVEHIRLRTEIPAGAWWGRGEAAVVCAVAENSEIQDVRITDMSGICENGISVFSEYNKIHGLTLRDVHLTVVKKEQSAMLCEGIDLRPYAYIKQKDSQFLLFARGEGDMITQKCDIRYETEKKK